MTGFYIPEKKKELLVTIWEYLLEKGMSEASIGDLCKSKKISQSSLYYWFKDKRDVWTSAGRYGVQKVALRMLEHTITNFDNLDHYCDTLFDEVDQYKEDLRLVVQITTNHVFGEYMRETLYGFNPLYEAYGARLIEISGCTPLQAEVFIYTIITLVVDYVVWDDRRKTKMLLDDFRDKVKRDLEEIRSKKLQ